MKLEMKLETNKIFNFLKKNNYEFNCIHKNDFVFVNFSKYICYTEKYGNWINDSQLKISIEFYNDFNFNFDLDLLNNEDIYNKDEDYGDVTGTIEMDKIINFIKDYKIIGVRADSCYTSVGFTKELNNNKITIVIEFNNDFDYKNVKKYRAYKYGVDNDDDEYEHIANYNQSVEFINNLINNTY